MSHHVNKSGARQVIFRVFSECMAEFHVGKLLSDLNDVYGRTAKITAVLQTTRGRTYDIEYEAIKLYGRNVSGILDRFRRSSDYVKILNDKVQELNSELLDVYYQTSNYCTKRLKRKVLEILGINITMPLAPSTTTATVPDARQGVREGENETVLTQKKIERIDSYSKLTSLFTFKERIKFKELGFKMAGDCIRKMRESMNVVGETSVNPANKAVSASHDKDERPQATTYKVYAKDNEKPTDEGDRIKVWHSEKDKKNSTLTYKLYGSTAPLKRRS